MASLIKKRGADARPGVTRVRERGETFNLYSGEALEGIRRACAASAEALAAPAAAAASLTSDERLTKLSAGVNAPERRLPLRSELRSMEETL